MAEHPVLLSREHLLSVAEQVGNRTGWDFSRIRASRDPVPWHYGEIVRRYVKTSDTVLDTGTGGGEKFLSLAPYFGRGVGIDTDAEMIRTAQSRLTPSLAKRIRFEQMSVHNLSFPDASFDAVLNRHARVDPAEIARVLRPGGVFITQQIGPRNAQNITRVFGCGPGGQYTSDPDQAVDALAAAFEQLGCAIVCRAEYDVPYYYTDLESFVFWLKAIPVPEDFDMARHWEQVAQIVAGNTTLRGIRTNEHRMLLIIRKQQ
ncbi:MAG: class I SAM-dependent methyltransferase [Anaerolineae bacterium]